MKFFFVGIVFLSNDSYDLVDRQLKKWRESVCKVYHFLLYYYYFFFNMMRFGTKSFRIADVKLLWATF